MKQKAILLSLIFFLASFFSQCTRRDNYRQLTGSYCLNREMNRDSLFLKSDHTYRHTYCASTGHMYEETGKWHFDSVNHEMVFRDFTFFNDEGSDGVSPGDWYSKVVLTDGNDIRLMYSSESDIFYLKTLNN